MNLKNTVLVFVIAIIASGIVLAMSAATFTFVSESRWTNNTASSNDTTEGGNITQGNFGSISLTDKWAAYFGNVTGSIKLFDGTSSVFTWSVGTDNATGEVCASTGNIFSFASANSTNGSEIDGAFSLTPGLDNASNTLSGACNMSFNERAVTNTQFVDHQDSNFNTCAIKNTSGTPVKNGVAFCTSINSAGSAFNGQSADFELMVATNDTASATETYFFYLELN